MKPTPSHNRANNRPPIHSTAPLIPAIELHNISKTFTERNWKTFIFRSPKYIKALDNVSLTVQQGTILGLLGPNGAGKTTLIKILATLVTPDSGTVRLAGISFDSNPMAIRTRIALVNTNDRSFYWRLTGRDNLDFFASLHSLHGSDKKIRIQKVLQLVGMENKADFKFMSYSAGQKQRLSIARAMLSKPEILLLDEATNSLDPTAAHKLQSFIKELVQTNRTTVIWCTHNLYEAELMCNRVVILKQGQVLYTGKMNDIRSSSCSSLEEAFSNISTQAVKVPQ